MLMQRKSLFLHFFFHSALFFFFFTSKTHENRYQQILELLLTGGYFRARINGISPFDKILGGLAWAISACNVDVDIDVFQVCSFFFSHHKND